MDAKRIIRLLEELETAGREDGAWSAFCPVCGAESKTLMRDGVLWSGMEHEKGCELNLILMDLRKEV